MGPRNLDIGVLRTFLLIAEGHGFAQAAARVGRSPSAVSLQVQKLEEELGTRLFRRNNREVALTLAGERLLGFARRLVSLNDEATLAFRPGTAPGRPLRLGTTQDFAETTLPELLRRFGLEHPEAELTLRVDRSAALVEAVRDGGLDLAVAIRRDDPLAQGVLLETPMLWVGREGDRHPADRPLPLVLFEPPCSFRAAALESLARAGRPHRVAFTSPSLSGLRSAVLAGLGLTVRTKALLGPGLADLGPTLALPPLPRVEFSLYVAPADGWWAARDDMVEIIRRTVG